MKRLRGRRLGTPEWLENRIDRLRVRVAESLLNLAEQLPEFKGGVIADLQTIRKHDRQQSEQHHSRTRPPDGAAISYTRCCLIDVFPIEEFSRLESGIRRLFPRADIKDHFQEFRASADNLLGGGWYRIGTLVKPGERRSLIPLPTEEMDLPDRVRSVTVSVHRLLPSLFAVSFHARLTNIATEALVRVQSAHHLSEVRFWPMVPVGNFYRTSSNVPDAVAAKATTHYLLGIRSDIEAALAPFISGHFMRRHRQGPRLPAVESYEVSGIETAPEQFSLWRQATSAWWESLAFNFQWLNAFRRDHLVFLLNHGFQSIEETTPYRLLILPTGTSDGLQHGVVDDFFIGVIPLVALREFVQSISADIGRARRKVYRTVSRQTILRGLRVDIALGRQVSRAAMLLERLNVEHEMGRRWWATSGLSTFLSEPEPKREPRDLFDTLVKGLDFQLNEAQRHVGVMEKRFGDYLLVQNMALMYGLQWAILFLTVVSIIVSSVGLVINWNQIEQFWQKSIRHHAAPPAPAGRTH